MSVKPKEEDNHTLDLGPFDELPPRLFETERLSLHAIEDEDAQLYFDMYASDPEVTKYMSFPTAKTVYDVAPFVRQTASYFRGAESQIKQFVWKIKEKESGKFIGSIGYGPCNDFTLGGGYILAKDYWGNGYATEAWGCVVAWAKKQPRVFRIEATFHPDNPASGNVMKKVGMAFEGTRKRSAIFPNVSTEPLDEAVCAWARD